MDGIDGHDVAHGSFTERAASAAAETELYLGERHEHAALRLEGEIVDTGESFQEFLEELGRDACFRHRASIAPLVDAADK